MWSASFESVDGLDDRGTWKEITSGPALLGCQDIYEQIALFPPCSHLHVGRCLIYRDPTRIRKRSS